jgi:hypothetical protein
LIVIYLTPEFSPGSDGQHRPKMSRITLD